MNGCNKIFKCCDTGASKEGNSKGLRASSKAFGKRFVPCHKRTRRQPCSFSSSCTRDWRLCLCILGLRVSLTPVLYIHVCYFYCPRLVTDCSRAGCVLNFLALLPGSSYKPRIPKHWVIDIDTRGSDWNDPPWLAGPEASFRCLLWREPAFWKTCLASLLTLFLYRLWENLDGVFIMQYSFFSFGSI